LVVYVGVLQIFTVRLIGASRLVVSVNRFSPSMSRYWGFVNRLLKRNVEYLSEKVNTLTDSEIFLQDRKIQVLLENTMGILMALPVGRYDVSKYLDSFRRSRSHNVDITVMLINSVNKIINVSLDDYFSFSNLSDSELLSALEMWGLEGKRAKFLVRERSVVTKRNQIAELSGYEVFVFGMVAAQYANIDLVVISYDLLLDVDETRRLKISNLLKEMNCKSLIAFDKPTHDISNWITQAIYTDENRVLGLFSIQHMIENGWRADNKGSANLNDLTLDGEDEEF